MIRAQHALMSTRKYAMLKREIFWLRFQKKIHGYCDTAPDIGYMLFLLDLNAVPEPGLAFLMPSLTARLSSVQLKPPFVSLYKI